MKKVSTASGDYLVYFTPHNSVWRIYKELDITINVYMYSILHQQMRSNNLLKNEMTYKLFSYKSWIKSGIK